MKKKSHERLIDYFIDVIPRLQNEYNERQRETDKVVIWLTALSAGSVALIMSNSNNIAINNPIFFKISVVLFILSIISGVIFRAHVYFLEQIQAQLTFKFLSFCYGYTNEHSGPTDIDDDDTIEDIAKSLKDDMGLDYDDWLSHDYLDRQFWVEHYQRWAKYWEEDDEKGLKLLGRQFAPLVHKKPDEAEDIFINSPQDNSTAFKFKLLTIICKASYISLLVFFGSATMSIALGYICS